MRTTARAVTSVLLVGTMLVGLGACGDDDDGDTASSGDGGSSTDTTAAPERAASDEFCTAFHNLDVAFASAPEDPAQLESFLAEQVEPNVATIRADIPDEVDGGVRAMLDTVDRVAASGDQSAFQSPEFAEAQGEVYPFLAEGCGWQEMAVTGIDFAYEDVPDTLDAGLTVLTIENDSEVGELHEIALMKLADDADITLDDLLALPEEEAQQYLDPAVPPVFAFAAPGMTGGTTADLVAGDYVYACFIPQGTTLEAEGTGPPHFMEGMAGQLTVA
jgi:hypothetical protein